MTYSQPLTIGCRVEYQPGGYSESPKHNGEPATVLVLLNREAKLRFEDGDEVWVKAGHCVWIPTLAEYEAAKAETWAAHLESMAKRDGGDCGPKRGGMSIILHRNHRRAKFKPD